MRSGEKAISEPDASGTERGNRARVTGVTRRVFFQAAATPLATVALAGLSRAAGHLSFPRRQGSGALGPAVGSGGDDVAHESGSERVWSPVLDGVRVGRRRGMLRSCSRNVMSWAGQAFKPSSMVI